MRQAVSSLSGGGGRATGLPALERHLNSTPVDPALFVGTRQRVDARAAANACRRRRSPSPPSRSRLFGQPARFHCPLPAGSS